MDELHFVALVIGAALGIAVMAIIQVNVREPSITQSYNKSLTACMIGDINPCVSAYNEESTPDQKLMLERVYRNKTGKNLWEAAMVNK